MLICLSLDELSVGWMFGISSQVGFECLFLYKYMMPCTVVIVDKSLYKTHTVELLRVIYISGTLVQPLKHCKSSVCPSSVRMI